MFAMKNCNRPRRRPRPRNPKDRGRGRARLAAALLLALLFHQAPALKADFTVQAGAFVEGFQDFVTVASGVDPTDGTTYIVGRNSANQAVLRKYDSSGGRLFWDGDGEVVTVTQINPKAMSVAVGTTNLYLVGGT